MSDHMPVHLPTPIPPTNPHTTLPAVVQPPGQNPYYAAPPQIVVMPQQSTGTPLSPVTTRLLLGGGIGAGAVVGFAIVGPTLIVTLQSLAITALAIGGAALAIAVAARMTLRSFADNRQNAGRRGRK